MRSAEYDAFGPWIMPVTVREEIPPLYRAHGFDLAGARLVLKLPRNVARRDATPSMDLYDHLVIVDDAALTVLSRRPGGYDERVIPHDAICAIDYGTDLLDGWITVQSVGAGGPAALTLSYVGTSQDVVEGLVSLVRSLYRSEPDPDGDGSTGRAAGGAAALPPLGQRDLGDKDIALVTHQLAVLRAEPSMRLLGYHRRQLLAAREGGGLRRLIRLVRPVVLHAVVVCGDDSELQVLHRRDWVTRGRHPEYSLACTVLLLARVDRAVLADDPRNAGVRVLTLHCGRSALELVVPAGSSTENALVAQLGDRLAR
ncbi:hypothetical protein DDP54_03330 [Cellulomonas sp. WB94]|uniref:hypothetical protein n=1 Tax=Cellulomonas sp. WB94 TaxID=2173174 RepID=UPI000D577918|nr:hypothetical protein [Cellulomonas sp. WB94]PVU82197.1 hypothetical protein DDP54_03330 [Cellulomonas sp. WB94]